MPLAHITKIEDARTGQWLRVLDPITDPIRRIDMGWTMGDWNQLDVSVETVALRGLIFYAFRDIRIQFDRANRRLVQTRRMGGGATYTVVRDLGRCRPSILARTRRESEIEHSKRKVDTGRSGKGASKAERFGLGCQGEFRLMRRFNILHASTPRQFCTG